MTATILDQTEMSSASPAPMQTPALAAAPSDPPAEESRLRNAALGLTIEQMNIVVVDPSRTMQTILRSMLQQMRPRRLRVHDTALSALRDMVMEPPHLVISEWKMEHMSGYGLIKIMRHESMPPLCAVPAIIVTGSATRSAVEGALRIGAHAVLAKPVSPAVLRQRIEWICRDERPLVLSHHHYVIDGVLSALDQQRAKDKLPGILQQIRSAEAQINGEEEVDNAQAPAQKSAPAGSKPKKLKAKAERSPTLDRLLRQRAQMSDVHEERARAARQVSREKVELSSTKSKKGGRSVWKELWGG